MCVSCRTASAARQLRSAKHRTSDRPEEASGWLACLDAVISTPSHDQCVNRLVRELSDVEEEYLHSGHGDHDIGGCSKAGIPRRVTKLDFGDLATSCVNCLPVRVDESSPGAPSGTGPVADQPVACQLQELGSVAPTEGAKRFRAATTRAAARRAGPATQKPEKDYLRRGKASSHTHTGAG